MCLVLRAYSLEPQTLGFGDMFSELPHVGSYRDCA